MVFLALQFLYCSYYSNTKHNPATSLPDECFITTNIVSHQPFPRREQHLLSKLTSMNSAKYIFFFFNLEKSWAGEIWSVPSSNTIPWSQSQATGSVLLVFICSFSAVLRRQTDHTLVCMHVYFFPSVRSLYCLLFKELMKNLLVPHGTNFSANIDYWYGIHVAHSHGSHD